MLGLVASCVFLALFILHAQQSWSVEAADTSVTRPHTAAETALQESMQAAHQQSSKLPVGKPFIDRTHKTARTNTRSRKVPARVMASTSDSSKATMLCRVDNFKDSLEKLLQLPGPHYIVFTADPDPFTGAPWCPDCVRTVPAVRRLMHSAGASLLEVEVGPRPIWKQAGHPFRHDPQLQLTGIPTLMRWSPQGPGAKLGKPLEKCRQPQEAVAVVAEFMKQQGDQV